MAKAAVWRWGCHGDRLLGKADTQGRVVVLVCVTVTLSDVCHLLQGYRACESSSGSLILHLQPHQVNHQRCDV